MFVNEEGFMNVLFNCTNKDMEIKDLNFNSCYGTVSYAFLRNKFSKLQSIELTDCYISDKITFPLTRQGFKLPDGISRTIYMRYEYSDPIHIEIPDNMFRRFVSFSKNGISGPAQITLDGTFQYVKISENFIERLDNAMFANARGIQAIILKNNVIHHLDDLALHQQCDLKFLDLSRNDISMLPINFFHNLEGIQHLNLGYNKLKNISSEMFRYQYNLQELRLENNNILIVNDVFSPMQFFNLNYISLYNNPLQELPRTLFYIRKLKEADLRFTSISLGNFTTFLESVDLHKLQHSTRQSQSSLRNDVLDSTENWRVLDLTGSSVKGFIIKEPNESPLREKLLIILKRFKFVLNGNPLTCFSDINPFNELIKSYANNSQLNGQEYFFKDWLCEYPVNLKGKKVLAINSSITNQKVVVKNCPLFCTCYARYRQNITIVDCRYQNLKQLPDYLPFGTVDLWMDNNEIEIFEFRNYLVNARRIILSYNKISKINDNVFGRMFNTEILKLDNNLLSFIPKSLKGSNLDALYLFNNPIICDCHTKWLKNWVSEHVSVVQNITNTYCGTHNGKTNLLIAMPYKDFVCPGRDLKILLGVLTPTLSIALVVSVWLKWFDVKIKLYCWFGIHPWDRKTPSKEENVDLFVIHANDVKNMVQRDIIGPLLKYHNNDPCSMNRNHFQLYKYQSLDAHFSNQIVIKNSDKDFLAGYSIQKNISMAVDESKHIVLVISPGMMQASDKMEPSDTLIAVLHECKRKISKRINHLYITYEKTFDIKSVQHIFLSKIRQLKKRQNRVTSSTLVQELAYVIHSYKIDNFTDHLQERSRIPSDDSERSTIRYDMVIYYSEDDKIASRNKIVDVLKERYRIFTSDDIKPGTLEINSLDRAISSSFYTILVVSRSCSLDKNQKNVFRIAKVKTSEYKNHLIVVFKDNEDKNRKVHRPLNDYSKLYVCLDLDKSDFVYKLQNALQPYGVKHTTNCWDNTGTTSFQY